MATKNKARLVSFDWMKDNQKLIKWSAIAREADVPYTRVANAFRYDRELEGDDMLKLSFVLARLCVSMRNTC